MSEVKEEVEKQEPSKVMSQRDISNIFNSDYATSVKRIYINSLGREVGFKEITVRDQKSLSRIMIDNETRQDVVFDAQCQLINKVAAEPFDIYECSEFDRLKLLIALYQANMFKNDVKFTCEQCGCQNKFKLDFQNVLHRLDGIELKPQDFHYENDNWSFDFKTEYPSVKKVYAFKQSYAAKYRGASKHQATSLDNMSNMEYINMFINEIKFNRKDAPNDVKTIKMSDYKVSEIEGSWPAPASPKASPASGWLKCSHRMCSTLMMVC